jgi:hypothetical protein
MAEQAEKRVERREKEERERSAERREGREGEGKSVWWRRDDVCGREREGPGQRPRRRGCVALVCFEVRLVPRAGSYAELVVLEHPVLAMPRRVAPHLARGLHLAVLVDGERRDERGLLEVSRVGGSPATGQRSPRRRRRGTLAPWPLCLGVSGPGCASCAVLQPCTRAQPMRPTRRACCRVRSALA